MQFFANYKNAKRMNMEHLFDPISPEETEEKLKLFTLGFKRLWQVCIRGNHIHTNG